MKNIPIGEVLKEYGYIDDLQLQEALISQRKHPNKRLGQHLIDLGFINEKQMLTALSERLNEPLLDLDEVKIEIDSVMKIPKALAQKYSLLAISEQNGKLSVVTSDPLNFYGIEDIRFVTGMNIDISLCDKASISRAIDYYYAEIEARTAATTANENVISFTFDDSELYNAQEDDTPVVKLLNSLLTRGYRQEPAIFT